MNDRPASIKTALKREAKADVRAWRAALIIIAAYWALRIIWEIVKCL